VAGYRNTLPYKYDWGLAVDLAEPPAALMPDAAGSSAIAIDDTTSSCNGSSLKACVITLLAACFEMSPPLAAWLGRGVLACWPGVRER
jgi:hypothetical protein